jgi:hypothetical protein
MQMNKDGKTQGVSLYVTLSPADADLLRAAVPPGIASRDTLGIKETSTLAEMALGAVCRAILRQGYKPRPLSAETRLDGPANEAALQPGVIRVQL